MDNFALRGGYLKPAERDSRIPILDRELQKDLAGMGAAD